MTATGVFRCVVVPSPRLPKRLCPQQYPGIGGLGAGVEGAGAHPVKAKLPATGTGDRVPDVPPLPSWPQEPSPQQ